MADRVVAHGRDQHRALRPRVVDRVLEVRAEAGVAEGHQDDVGAVVSGPDDARYNVAVLPLAGDVEHRHRHDGHARIGDARDPLDRHVVGLRGDDPGEPRPVTGGVRHPVGAVEDGRARHHRAGEVRMEGVDAGVQERDRRRARGRHRSEHLVPAYLRQRPLVRVERIPRNRLRHTSPVLLDADDLGICLVARPDRGEVARRHVDDVQPEHGDDGPLDAAVARDDIGLLLGAEPVHQLDEQRGRRGRALGRARRRNEQGARDREEGHDDDSAL